MRRRHFLSAIAATLPALGVSGRLFAAPESAPRLLLVFLRGGYDCANVLVPYSSEFYYESRPNIAIARPAGKTDDALVLDTNWALAPALQNVWSHKETSHEV